MTTKTKVKEIFTSIQGEGSLIGFTQLFIRFCKCNLKCKNCDTDYLPDDTSEIYTPNSLAERLKTYDTKNIHSICLLGGEPLLDVVFLKEFLRNVFLPVHLVTSAINVEELLQIINMVKYVTANIKLPSVTGEKDYFKKNAEFLKICKQARKDVNLQIIFDENITDEEIEKCVELAEQNDLEIILQPVSKQNKITIPSRYIPEVLEKFRKRYWNVRLIPQVHKILAVR